MLVKRPEIFNSHHPLKPLREPILGSASTNTLLSHLYYEFGALSKEHDSTPKYKGKKKTSRYDPGGNSNLNSHNPACENASLVELWHCTP